MVVSLLQPCKGCAHVTRKLDDDEAASGSSESREMTEYITADGRYSWSSRRGSILLSSGKHCGEREVDSSNVVGNGNDDADEHFWLSTSRRSHALSCRIE